MSLWGKQKRIHSDRQNSASQTIFLIYPLYLCVCFSSSCVEPYQFRIENKDPALVVEGFISDASFQETVVYPSDGRYFYVKLSYTSDVINIKGEAVNGASVSLLSNTGERWEYAEVGQGEYLLLDKDFKACEGAEYKVGIILASQEEYESEWQALPTNKKEPIGEVSFDEQTRDAYVMIAGEQQVLPLKGIAVSIDLPKKSKKDDHPVYYRWDFEPVWVYRVPPTALIIINPICWVRSKTYLSQYTLHEDLIGGYKKELFFVETINNDRFYDQFSLLVRQFSLNEGYYQFWNEMQTRIEVDFNDSPPFNLATNLMPVNHSGEVVGYFGVVQESATRWYFNKQELSYFVENGIKKLCENTPVNFEILSHCEDCLLYPFGDATLEKPDWWLK